MPKPKPEEESQEANGEGGAKRWIDTIGINGVKVQIGVFGEETDADALARAKEIDDRLDREGKSKSSLI